MSMPGATVEVDGAMHEVTLARPAARAGAHPRSAAGPGMRIIAGRWRGRRIRPPADARVRPTADRVREAWMSIVQPYLSGARVLDLFAGSGALGLEALSRGAVSADLVEVSQAGITAILNYAPVILRVPDGVWVREG